MKKPLSRFNYENNNPVVSARISMETYKKLQLVLKNTNMKLPRLIEHIVNGLEPKLIPIEKAKEEASDRGWEEGFSVAKDIYAVSYPCSKCRKEIIVKSDEEKAFIRKMMRQNDWHHGNCADPD
jgi:hypothetical protein